MILPPLVFPASILTSVFMVCVCVCEGERERDIVCVCVCVHMYVRVDVVSALQNSSEGV